MSQAPGAERRAHGSVVFAGRRLRRLRVVSIAAALIALVVGFGGVILGALLTRRNDRRARADVLLVEALNDAVAAIAEVAGGGGPDALIRYASAVSRVALHAPPEVAEAWRRFQDDATTGTLAGRARLLAAIQAARHQLGHGSVSDVDLAVLLFGPHPPPTALGASTTGDRARS